MSEIHDVAAEPEGDAELFVDFINTLELTDGQPEDHLPDAAALRSWLYERNLCGARQPLADIDASLPAFRDLRAALYDTTGRLAAGKRPTAAQVKLLNAAMRDGLHYHQIKPVDGGSRFTVAQVGDELAQARASIAGSLAHYLAEHDLGRVRVCANDGCRWRFIDRSPAGRRRWCDMRTCGNRAKVARHRARARVAAPAAAADR
ncbi:MAG TPA: CGNR zinc finger domain-containing protein [Candidatus Limnocylindria bacterium]|nr:CGNR zinc finger domain-containing protein [Candidatus Limnocylindria bacterium]